MALLSLRHDPVPPRVKIDLQLHRAYRTWFGFGRLRCEWCGGRWGAHGCTFRESAARLFAYTATPVQKSEALASGLVTRADLKLKRPRRVGRHREKQGPSLSTLLGFPAATA
ncbi:hypothetical protein [Glycomyces sp. NPDC048151]|uniref:hypothetical protein n=1 Tax=Glycomyces sp. NPDC048151 TaxID=3364002 RepID=UPI003712CE1B